jgi:hypothetical protein
MEDQTSLDKIKEKLYTKLHDGFFAQFQHFFTNSFSTRELVKFFEYRPRLGTPLLNRNFQERDKRWEAFLDAKCKDTTEAWDYFLKK